MMCMGACLVIRALLRSHVVCHFDNAHISKQQVEMKL